MRVLNLSKFNIIYKKLNKIILVYIILVYITIILIMTDDIYTKLENYICAHENSWLKDYPFVFFEMPLL